jgi:preprotein translocase subunit SecF
MELFHGTNFDFIGKRYYYFAFTLIMAAIAAFGFIKYRGPLLGLEFTGGTQIQISFNNDLPGIEDIRKK